MRSIIAARRVVVEALGRAREPGHDSHHELVEHHAQAVASVPRTSP